MSALTAWRQTAAVCSSGHGPSSLSGKEVDRCGPGPLRGLQLPPHAGRRRPARRWIFEGIDGDIIGDFGLSGGGAARFEFDRADFALGTPPNALILAHSGEHQRHFVVVPEEPLTHVTTATGERPKALIRAQIVYFETVAGGAVFSTGSITFCGSLSTTITTTNVSRLLENVLRRFARSAPST